MKPFATRADLELLWRPLQEHEKERADALLDLVSNELRLKAEGSGIDLDQKAKDNVAYAAVLRSVTVDVVARTLLTSTENEPMTQFSQSALGYSVSGSYLVPGGGLFIKRSELARLGLNKQRFGVIEFYEQDIRHPGYFEAEEPERN